MGPDVRARRVAKEYKTHAKPELYESTPPLEALKIVLSEIATGKRGGNVVAIIHVRRAHFYAPARKRVFVELPPEDHQPGDEHTCGPLQYSLYGTHDAAQNWEEELTSTLYDLKIDTRDRMPMRVARIHQGKGPCCNCARRRHHRRWRTVGGGTPHQNDISRSK